MGRIHLIQKDHRGRPEPVDREQHIWSSGNWVFRKSVNVGDDLYLHEQQQAPSWWGGRIIEIVDAGQDESKNNRVKYVVNVTGEHRGIRCREGWSNEQAYHP